VLRGYEEQLETEALSALPDELRPDADAVSLADVARAHAVSESALDGVSFPDHERVGRTLIRPAVLDEVASRLEPGLSLEAVDDVLGEWAVTETSAVVSALGYEIAWEGLGGGTLQRKG
jgi:hypothetical protein